MHHNIIWSWNSMVLDSLFAIFRFHFGVVFESTSLFHFDFLISILIYWHNAVLKHCSGFYKDILCLWTTWFIIISYFREKVLKCSAFSHSTLLGSLTSAQRWWEVINSKLQYVGDTNLSVSLNSNITSYSS